MKRRGGDSVLVAFVVKAPRTRLRPLPAASCRLFLPPVGEGSASNPPCNRSNLSLRRGGDSNPRYPFGIQLLSREPDSAALAPLQIENVAEQEGFGPRRLHPEGFLGPGSARFRRHRAASSSLRSARAPLRIPRLAIFKSVAEQEGFEPSVPFGTAVFKTASLDRSDTAP